MISKNSIARLKIRRQSDRSFAFLNKKGNPVVIYYLRFDEAYGLEYKKNTNLAQVYESIVREFPLNDEYKNIVKAILILKGHGDDI